MFKSKKVILLKPGAKNQGGLEKYAHRIALAFVEKGAQVTYLSTGEPPKNISGVDFQSLPVKSCLSVLKLRQFDAAVKKWLTIHTADIIFGLDRNREQTHLRAGNGVHAAFLKSRLLSEGKTKYYLSLANPLHRQILSIEKEAYSHPRLKKIFTNSKMVRKELIDYYSIDSNKIQVVYNGVEWKEMEPDFTCWKEAKTAALKRHNLDPNSFHLLFVGHSYLRKGLDPLIEALSRWKFRDFQLSVVGSEKRLDQYKEKIKKLNMERQIHFFGPQSKITPFYQMADALVIPSFYDPFANVTLEALAMGVFVVSSKTNGGHEILNEQNGAIIEDLLDSESILNALNQALKLKKTEPRALQIRQSISYLDFSHQLNQLITACG